MCQLQTQFVFLALIHAAVSLMQPADRGASSVRQIFRVSSMSKMTVSETGGRKSADADDLNTLLPHTLTERTTGRRSFRFFKHLSNGTARYDDNATFHVNTSFKNEISKMDDQALNLTTVPGFMKSTSAEPNQYSVEWLSVKDAGAKGSGLFALRPILEGTLLGEYTGEIITHRQYTARHPSGQSEYVFLVSEKVQRRKRIYVDATDKAASNIFRFMNHDGIKPNVEAEVVFRTPTAADGSKLNGKDKCIDRNDSDEVLPSGVKKRRAKSSSETLGQAPQGFQIVMRSITDIAEGDELCFDYGPLYTTTESWSS